VSSNLSDLKEKKKIMRSKKRNYDEEGENKNSSKESKFISSNER
jgi:hypothetical protein